jgi:hypothetical protein
MQFCAVGRRVTLLSATNDSAVLRQVTVGAAAGTPAAPAPLPLGVAPQYDGPMQRLLIALGVLLLIAGVAWPWLSRLPWGRQERLLASRAQRLRDVRQEPDGARYALADNDKLLRYGV